MVAVCVIIKVDGLMVGGMGLEPIRQKACDFKSQTATNYVTRPLLIHLPISPSGHFFETTTKIRRFRSQCT